MRHRRPHRRHRLARVFALVVALLLPLVGGSALALPIEIPGTETGSEQTGATQSSGSGSELEGLFRVEEGECGDGEGVTSGSYFRMVDSSGGHISNGDSPCDDDTYTPLSPGSDGGLETGDYQPHPDPAFNATGNGLNDTITEPQGFFGTEFSTATNPTDPQTDTDVPPPSVTHDGGTLSGDVRAFAAAWNGQHFNQGSPKPDGSMRGNTTGPEGTYDPDTGRYALSWTSEIEGGPFDGFTGVWHFEGTFEGQQLGAAGSTDDGADTPAAPAGTQGSTSVAGNTATGGAQASGGAASGGSEDPLPRTGASSAVPLGGLLLALGGGLRWLALRSSGRRPASVDGETT